MNKAGAETKTEVEECVMFYYFPRVNSEITLPFFFSFFFSRLIKELKEQSSAQAESSAKVEPKPKSES